MSHFEIVFEEHYSTPGPARLGEQQHEVCERDSGNPDDSCQQPIYIEMHHRHFDGHAGHFISCLAVFWHNTGGHLGSAQGLEMQSAYIAAYTRKFGPLR